MSRLPILIAWLALAAALSPSAFGQQASAPAAEEDAESPAENTAETDADSESVDEDVEIDDTSYLDTEEEDFRPSEEIPADQSIAFPTDI